MTAASPAGRAAAPVPPATSLVSKSRWNLTAFAFTLAAHVVVVPVVIGQIGLAQFGAAGLVLAAFAPFILVGTVLGQSAVRELAHRVDTNDAPASARVLGAVVTYCAAGCAGVALLFIVFAPVVLEAVGVLGGLEIDHRAAVSVAAAGWAAQQFALVLQSAVVAAQRYVAVAASSAGAALLTAAATLGAVYAWPSALGYLVGTAAGFVLCAVLWWAAARRAVPSAFPLQRATRAEYAAIRQFGKWQSVSHFAGAVGGQMDRYVLGVLTVPAVVGQYNAAMRLQEVVHMAVLKAGEVLFPHFRVTAAEPPERRLPFYLAASWVMNTIAACLLAPLLVLAAPILTLWIGPEVGPTAADMLRVLAAAGIAGAGANVYFYFAMGMGEAARLASLTAVHAALATALTVGMIAWLGPQGAGAGFLLASIVRVALVLRLTRMHFGAAVSASQLATCVAPLACGLTVGAALTQVPMTLSSWPGVMVAYPAIGLAVLIATVAATSLGAAGRVMIRHTWLSARPSPQRA